MEIKWNNLLLLAMGLFTLFLLLEWQNDIGDFLGMIGSIGDGSPHGLVFGASALAMVGWFVASIIRMLKRN